MPTLADLAEDTLAYVLPSPLFEPVVRSGYVYVVSHDVARLTRVRRVELDWPRAESRRLELGRTEWWLGWSAPPDAADRLLRAGLVPDEVPSLTGMTCTEPPPLVPEVEVRRAESLDQYLELLAVEWTVWGATDVAERLERERRLFPRLAAAGTVHHYGAYLEGRLVGAARGVDAEGAVALMGGTVLADARGRGVYRALVRARWDDAVARGTPVLAVQAGEQSAPILAQLGFESRGEVRVYVDPASEDRSPSASSS